MYTSEYSPPEFGFFREADHCPPAGGSAFGRCGNRTFDLAASLNRTIDYIFFEPRFCCATASTGTPLVSDHKILSASLDIVA